MLKLLYCTNHQVHKCIFKIVFRIYNNTDQTALHTVHVLYILEIVLLIDEVENDLHSKDAYIDVLHHILFSQPEN